MRTICVKTRSTFVYTLIIILLTFLFSFDHITISRGVPSSNLTAVKIADGNTLIIEYQNSAGVLTFASDKEYAFIKIVYSELGQVVQEFYFDENGKPARQSAGHCGLAREYNENNQNIKVTYLGADGDPILNTSGYVTSVRTFNDKDQVIQEIYYGLDGNLVQLSAGQCGTYYSYDEMGHQEKATFTNEKCLPIVNKSGYTTLYRTFNDDGGINTEYFLDINDNPVRVNGAYGIKRLGNYRFFVNTNGMIIISLSNVVQNFPWLIAVFAIILSFIVGLPPLKHKYGLLILYIFFILCQTIFNRETGGTLELTPFWSYRQFFSSYSLRLEILNNIWLFVPFGAALYSIFKEKRKLRWLLLIPLFFSILIEGSQYFFGLGLCEVDDVISNTLGGAIGMMMAASMLEIKEWWKNRKTILGSE